MCAARPALPPRRQPPPLPPRSRTGSEGDEVIIPKGIAARIASLQLGQVGHTKPALAKKPPPIPLPRQARETPAREPVTLVTLKSTTGKYPVETRNELPPPVPPNWTRPKPEDLARALARRPPPPPKKPSAPLIDTFSTLSFPLNATHPQRRLPPIPPPPESEPDYQHPANDAAVSETYDNDGSGSCSECRDFTHVDAHAAFFPRHAVTSLDNLVYDLTEPFPYEVEKARAIFTWLHHNIAYDAESFLSGNVQTSTPESTLSSGLAVCDGYAGLFKSLAERVGIHVHKVTGHGKGIGYQATEPGLPIPKYAGNHAWNCIFLDGEWHLIDSCWGAGALHGSIYQQRFDARWFTSSPREFGRTHFPEDPSYQLISDDDSGPVSWEDYIMEPAGPTIFVDFYNLDLWPTALLPSTRTVQGGTRVFFSVFKRCEHMSTADSDNFVYLISVGNERVALEVNSEGGWGADVYIPEGSSEVSLFYVTTVNNQDAKGIGIRALKNALGRAAMTFGGLAKWSVV
ncbi:hypothetical protein C0991_005630 [Blastosporella zonata]|nr:hypothetical protein C0991_005630 [Blastosporella zonata]